MNRKVIFSFTIGLLFLVAFYLLKSIPSLTGLALSLFYLIFLIFRNYILEYFNISSIGRKPSLPFLTLENRRVITEELRRQVMERTVKYLDQLSQSKFGYIPRLNWTLQRDGKRKRQISSLWELTKISGFNGTQSLIIYGKAGVGKTLSVYQFMHQAMAKDKKFVPLYISLSTYQGQGNLLIWTIKEASKIYGLNQRHLAECLDQGHIYLVFDGIDGALEQHGKTIVNKIMRLRAEKPMTLVMKEDSIKLFKKELKGSSDSLNTLFQIYYLNPFKPKQAENMIREKGNSEKLFAYLSNNELKFLSRFPLFLKHFLELDTPPNSVMSNNRAESGEIFAAIWEEFENERFRSLPESEVRKSSIWKNYLAKLATEGAVFFIDAYQPETLNKFWSRTGYRITSRVFAGLMLSLVAGTFLSGTFNFWDAGIITGLILSTTDALRNRRDKQDIKVFSSSRIRKFQIKSIIIDSVLLIITLAFYFGLLTPHDPNFSGEMLLNGALSTTEMIVGAIIGILMSIFFGVRQVYRDPKQDIWLVEQLKGSLSNFAQAGWKGGLLLAIFLMPFVFMLEWSTGQKSAFYSWLGKEVLVSNEYALAFLVGFSLGFLFFGTLGYMKPKEAVRPVANNFLVSSGSPVWKSLINGIKAFIFFSAIAIPLIGLVIWIMVHEPYSLWRAVQSCFAVGLLGFFWNGGLDFFMYWILRFFMWLEGNYPWKLGEFLKRMASLGILRPVGTGYEFIHPTLRQYKRQKFTSVKDSRWFSLIPLSLAGLLIIPLFIKIDQRFAGQRYWTRNNFIQFELNTSALTYIGGLRHQFVVRDSLGTEKTDLRITATGKVSLGTFVGQTGPRGTRIGFLGIPLEDAYNLPECSDIDHGALVIQKNNETPKGMPSREFGLSQNRIAYIDASLKIGDTLSFYVNDKEWQNNTGLFQVTIGKLVRSNNKPEIIAHRGGSPLAPENSLTAIKNAINMGVDRIEIDVRATRDRQLVLMHDESLKRTTNLSGKVERLTRADLSNGILKSSNTLERIPDLSDALDLVSQSKSQLLIEVKTNNPNSFPMDELVKIIENFGVLEKTQIFSFNRDFCKELKQRYPYLTVGVFIWGLPRLSKIPQVDLVGVEYHSLIFWKGLIKRLHDNYDGVYAWTVNTDWSVQQMVELEVDGIISDKPESIQRLLEF